MLAEKAYRLQIIYAGGDDLFLVGNWSDVIYAAIDIRRALDDFTGNGVLTISAGVGMFDAKYPIARMAAETGKLEDAAKLFEGEEGGVKTAKNALALWNEDTVYSWPEFTGEVMPLFEEVLNVCEGNEKGKAFIYSLLSLLRNADDAISVPRLAYLLARSFEDVSGGSAHSRRFFDLATGEKSRRYLITALEWYVYSIRERG